MDKRDKKIRQLENERNRLMTENQELKYIINDIQAAKAAGCPSVGLTYGYNYGEAIDLSQPDVIYQSINDLLPALGLPHSENQESKND